MSGLKVLLRSQPFAVGVTQTISVVDCYALLRQYAFSDASDEHISAFFTTNFIALHIYSKTLKKKLIIQLLRNLIT